MLETGLFESFLLLSCFLARGCCKKEVLVELPASTPTREEGRSPAKCPVAHLLRMQHGTSVEGLHSEEASDGSSKYSRRNSGLGEIFT